MNKVLGYRNCRTVQVQVSRSLQPEQSSLAEKAEIWCPVLALLLRRQALHKRHTYHGSGIVQMDGFLHPADNCAHLQADCSLSGTSLVVSSEYRLLCGRHGIVMEHGILVQTLVRVSEPLKSMLEPGRPADLPALWLLRCAAELAAAWPGLEGSARGHQAHAAPQDPEGRWQVRCLR